MGKQEGIGVLISAVKNKFGKIALILFVFAVSAMAEGEEPKVDTAAIMKMAYNLQGGLNFSFTRSPRSAVGFHAGVMVDNPLTLMDIVKKPYLLEFHWGAQFIRKVGRKWIESDGNDSDFDAYYLEIPLFFSLKKTFSESIAVRGDLGPYIAFGLFGTRDIFGEKGLERFDAGIIYGVTVYFADKYSLGTHIGTGFNGGDLFSLYITFGYKL